VGSEYKGLNDERLRFMTRVSDTEILKSAAAKLRTGKDDDELLTLDELQRDTLAELLDKIAAIDSEIVGFTRETLIAVRCGACGDGEQFAVDGFGYQLVEDEAAAIELVDDCDGAIVDGVAHCSACLKEAGLIGAGVNRAGELPHGERSARVIPIEGSRK
jgi:hypothetical protein